MKEIKNYTAEKYKKKVFQILNKREHHFTTFSKKISYRVF